MAFEKLTELFTYGTLQPGQTACPKTIRGWVFDHVQGVVETTLDHPPVLRLVKTSSASWVNGYTIRLDEKELTAIDAYEGPDYKRVKTKTYLGFDVWVYVGK